MDVKGVLIAGLIFLLSLIAAGASLMLAEFGAPAWVFVVLFAWLLTLGLPTLAAVLILARFWQGPSFGAYLLAVVLLAFGLHLGAVFGARRGIQKWRQLKGPR